MSTGFTFDKSISLGNVLTAIILGGSAVAWGSGINKQLAVHDAEISGVKEQQKQAAEDSKATRVEIRGDLQEINRKIDRVLERK